MRTYDAQLDALLDALASSGYAYASFKDYPLVTLDGSFTLDQLAAFVAGWHTVEQRRKPHEHPRSLA